MIYLYLFGTCFHFIYVFMIIGNIPSLATAQRLLEQLCDLGYEDILDIILDN